MAWSDPMPSVQKQAVHQALRAAGYQHVAQEFEFVFSAEPSAGITEAPVPLAAFWQEPFDQFSSALAVRWLESPQASDPFLKTIARDLWAPFAIIARPQHCELWETLPDARVGGRTRFSLLGDHLPYNALSELLAERQDQLGPRAVEGRKQRWRQMALYELSPEPAAFLEWAYRPARERLSGLFQRVFDAARQQLVAPGADLDSEQLQWLIRLLGVRIMWDKKWLDAGLRTSGNSIFRSALQYPTRLSESDAYIYEDVALPLADIVASKLGAVHLGTADSGLLSQHLQERGLPSSLQRQWRLYPTPPSIAWGLLKSLPIEALAENERRVWDGTCGSGTFLVAALDRLRALVPHLRGQDLRDYLLSKLAGNDLAPTLADATRVALDLTLGAAAGPAWQITFADVSKAPLPFSEGAPMVICSNPPFKTTGRAVDSAIQIIHRYIDILPAGGLLAVLAPRPLLTNQAARHLRRELLNECDLFEVWELPSGLFPGTDTETAAFIGRKRYKFARADQVTTWRILGKDRRPQNVEALPTGVWRRSQDYAIEAPLALRLTEALAHCPRLREYVPQERRTEGITLRREAREHGDVSHEYKNGWVPYLAGRRGMQPFYIPWEHEKEWLNYGSPRIRRPRGGPRHKGKYDYEHLFKSTKILVSRLATWGSSWRVRAAVDQRGLYPSDGFIALAPLPPFSLEVIASLLNSSLVNCWLRHVNPSTGVRIEELLSIPIPHPGQLDQRAVERIEWAARRIAEARAITYGSSIEDPLAREEIEALTLEIDTLVYDFYGVQLSLQDEISRYFLSSGDPRPGFDRPMVSLVSTESPQATPIFSQRHAQRMHELFGLRNERGLSAQEDLELERLVNIWEEASLVKVRKDVLPPRGHQEERFTSTERRG